MRASGRKLDELRNVVLEPDVSKHAEGSCLAMFGDTQVLCTVSVENRVPSWLRDTGQGWITAEYGMLPRSTNSRIDREAARGKQSGRTLEIQRLIGRSLRAVTDLKELGEIQIKLDCDVIQADGGTRTAAITGAFIALYRALIHCQSLGLVDTVPIIDQVAAISCGLYKGRAILDLDYEEDSNAEADANFVLTGTEQIVEIQSTAETTPFTKNQFFNLLQLAQIGIAQLIDLQKHILKIS